MAEPPKIYFVLSADIRGVSFNPAKPDGLTFKRNQPSIDLKIALRDPEHDQFGHWSGLLGTVRGSLDTSAEAHQFVAGLLQRKFIPYGKGAVKLPRIVRGEEKVDAHGNMKEGYYPPFSVYPAEVQELVEAARAILEADLRRFLALLRWRQDMEARHELIEHATLYWGVGDVMLHVPTPHVSRTIPTSTGIAWQEADEADLDALWSQAGLGEPLGHELLREAATLAATSPRSSILITATALEAGVKAHCGSVAPDSAWLFENLPSPPVHKVLKSYVPSIHKERGQEVGFWETAFAPLASQVSKLFEVRNKLTHTGTVPADAKSAEEYILLATDLLYGLYVLRGHDWAKERVSYAIRRKLHWPDPRRPETFVTIMPPE